jgi:hypothetical protein
LKKFNKTREDVQVYKTVLPFVYSHRSAAQFNSKTVSHHPIIAYFFHEKGVQGIALSQQPPLALPTEDASGTSVCRTVT